MLRLEPLSMSTFPAFADLLGGPDFGGCFCAVWTAFRDPADRGARCADPARPNLDETRRRVEAGEHVGFLVKDATQVVGWTGAGPKPSFPLLATSASPGMRRQAVPELSG